MDAQREPSSACSEEGSVPETGNRIDPLIRNQGRLSFLLSGFRSLVSGLWFPGVQAETPHRGPGKWRKEVIK